CLRPGSVVADDFRRHQRPQPATGSELSPPPVRAEEAGRVRAARARRVDHLEHWLRADDLRLPPAYHNRAQLAPRQRRDLTEPWHPFYRVFEVVDLVERHDLRLVREKDVDVVLDQVEELFPVPVD